MNIYQISPYIRTAEDSYLPENCYFAERMIFDYELLFLKEGRMRVTVDDDEYQGRPGDIFFFRPKQRHSVLCLRGCQVHQPHIHFDFFEDQYSNEICVCFRNMKDILPSEMKYFRTDVADMFYTNIPSLIRIDAFPILEEKLQRLISEYQIRSAYYNYAIKGIFIEIWVELLRQLTWMNTPNSSHSKKVAYQIREFLVQNLDRELTLDEIAAEVHISKYHLSRIFHNSFHCPPIHYHLVSRINKAKTMLQYSDETITHIADACGFSSIHTFSRAFKRIENVPPSCYKR